MAKRKAKSEEEDFEESDASREASPPPKKKSVKKPKPVEKDNEVSEEERPILKGRKASTSRGTAASSSVTDSIQVHKTSEGDSFVDIGKKRRATVRNFKGKPLIDIREFYGNDGDEKPGKKGISLTEDQWEMLKKSVPVIDRLFTEQTK
ncbi:hypothetical protein E1B28_000501 [Marasmius oreades]|uniref:Transcriptional coactivator p15 (PC4) C-terminal domain-containing protein n=1 Tax=Marasmius oreades TaxID=181124 RepID=A0A9P7V1K0_9AGAR|nr:uncharacterized protein E1B28_000501 [Marasmius oreades]KAG7098568.1 hypothetical protein E1B28_000501 [Marasmius oreades]